VNKSQALLFTELRKGQQFRKVCMNKFFCATELTDVLAIT